MIYKEMHKKVLEIFPDAEIEWDNDGQIIIYTGMMVAPDSPTTTFGSYKIVPFTVED
jgi:hypothetical protein